MIKLERGERPRELTDEVCEQIDDQIEQKVQKKSEKDKNGIIGGLVFGIIGLFFTYQIYDKFFEFSIGKIFVYILGFLTFICLAVSVSCFFDYKESKKIEMKMQEKKKKNFQK